MAVVWIVASVMFIAGVACIIIGTPLGRPVRVALRERRARTHGVVASQPATPQPRDDADSSGPYES